MISVALSYPVIVYPCRESIDRIFYPETVLTYFRFVVQNISIVILAFGISALFPSFNTILGIFGAVTSTTIGYILPAIFYLRTSRIPIREDPRAWLAWTLGLTGGISGFVAFIVVVKNAIDNGI